MASSSSTIIPVDVKPGIIRNFTPVEAENYYVDGDHIRFRDLQPEKIGGWESQISGNSITGVARSMLAWQALDQTKYIGVGTNTHLYARQGGIYYDITPILGTSSLTDPLTTTSASSEVEILDTSHGANVGDYISFPSSVVLDGITLLGPYVIIEVVDPNNYIIDAGTLATGSTSGGGGSVDIDYYIGSGLADSGIAGYGYGVGLYGEEEYGTARSTGLIEDARIWALDNWGEDLLALPIGGALYHWDTSGGTGARATVVSDAPSKSNWMIVASYFRQCILFGTENISNVYDPLLIRWSDAEDYTVFTPDSGNNAGEYRLTRGNTIVGAIETRNGEILVFTDTSTYRMRPRNDDLVYEVTLVGDNSGLISPKSVIDIDGKVFWASRGGFRYYDGTVRILPSTLDLFYFDASNDGYINQDQIVKCHVGRNREYNEIIFNIPDKNNIEINRYIAYNYKDNVWYDGTWQRTAWADAGTFDTPLAFDRAGTLFAHEQGKNDDGAPLEAFVTTGFYKIEEGNSMMFVDRFIFDGSYEGNIDLELNYKKFPNSSEIFTKNYVFNNMTEQVPVRARGRFISFTMSTNQVNGDMRVGKIFAAVQPSGRR